jgi:hypothetical protein
VKRKGDFASPKDHLCMDGLRNGQITSPTTAAMDVNTTIAEFVHRYQSLSAHRDSQDNLIKVSSETTALQSEFPG